MESEALPASEHVYEYFLVGLAIRSELLAAVLQISHVMNEALPVLLIVLISQGALGQHGILHLAF